MGDEGGGDLVVSLKKLLNQQTLELDKKITTLKTELLREQGEKLATIGEDVNELRREEERHADEVNAMFRGTR